MTLKSVIYRMFGKHLKIKERKKEMMMMNEEVCNDRDVSRSSLFTPTMTWREDVVT